MKANDPSWMRTLRKIDDYRWEIPMSYKPGMRVPGLVFASERMLLQIAEEQALEQVANVATLPGIVKYSLAMPDIHWGYGFPVGGVAAFDVDEGIISPGGIGFDVNCLAADTRVVSQFGYYRDLRDFDLQWMDESIKCVNPHKEVRNTRIIAYLKRSPKGRVYRIITESGQQIAGTGDHPFFTPSGMIPLKDLDVGDKVSVYGFEGVPYDSPTGELLVDESDIARVCASQGNACQQITNVLRARGLLPLCIDNPKLPLLVKLLGFIQGDGSLRLRKNSTPLAFYGDPENLEDIRRDLQSLAFSPSPVYQRHRRYEIATHYGVKRFRRTESYVHLSSTALATLLHALGATAGNKAKSDFTVPHWLDAAPKWIKRLYLAAFFGAELSRPMTITKHQYNFYGPVLSINKAFANVGSGYAFLMEIREWLAEFGVESSLLRERRERVNSRGDVSTRLRLQISSKPENLIALWTRVGFEYHRRKQYLGCLAAQYLRLKMAVLSERRETMQLAQEWRNEGIPPHEIVTAFVSPSINASFVTHALQGRRNPAVRIGTGFPTFAEFVRVRTKGLGKTGQAWDLITSKEEVNYSGLVYDFTVADPTHNFIANSFVVSNCGVRVIRTDLSENEVRPNLERLVDVLFSTVPAGVGGTGRVKLDRARIDRVLAAGARWAVAEGFGWGEDLEVIEAGGAFQQADPDRVSSQAKDRGRGQVGTLGSGNHFLEVQVVDQVFDERASEALGLELGKVVVFIHSGSRGLGHQVCTDYLRVAERANNQKYHFNLVDRQLACVPFNSPEGQDYFGAMCAAANFAWANRQLMTHWAREAFARVFEKPAELLGMRLVYDVAHNIAKLEEYEVNGHRKQLVVHRKGATRAFPPGHPEIPARYRNIGQPVLIPGDMGRYSFVAVGTPVAMQISFGSTCHGAGRVLGRKAAVRALAGKDVAGDLRARGIIVRAQDRSLLSEEAPEAYKDVADVVGVCHNAGISKRVVRTRPLGVVKG